MDEEQQICYTNTYSNENWSKLSKYNHNSIQLTRPVLILWLHDNLPKKEYKCYENNILQKNSSQKYFHT